VNRRYAIFAPTAASINIQMIHYGNSTSSAYFDNISVREWLGAGECVLFQDAAGTTPAYMPGQGQIDPPIGLMLDKRLGLVRGPERLVNGDFSAGAAGWSIAGQDATHVVTFANGTLRYQSDTTTPVLVVSQIASMVVGKWYEITVTVSSWAGGLLKSDAFVQISLPIASGLGTFKVIGLAATTTFSFSRNSANVDLTIDAISVRELQGNHAYQVSTPSRPALTGRYNLLVNTNWPGAQSGAPGVAPTGWTMNFSTASVTAVTDLGANYAIQFSATAQRSFLSQSFAVSAYTTYSITVDVIENSGLPISQIIGTTGAPAGSVTQFYLNGVLINGDATAPVGSRIELRLAIGSTTATVAPRFGIGTAINATGVVTIARPDMRVFGDGVGLPSFQRVVDPNTYDTVGFPPRLRFDGIDDFFQVGPVDFSATNNIFVGVGARKLSDAATGLVIELSTGTGASNPGSFALYSSPNSAAQVGAIAYVTGLGYKYAPISAPANYVQTVQLDASLPAAGQIDQRVNESGAVALSGGDIGAGNFGNYAMFMGRRGAGGSLFAGYVSQAIVCGKRVSAPEANAVKKLINSKTRAF